MPHVSPQPSRPVRVLFVCLGNICRSPSAEGLFRHYVASQGAEGDYEIDSAGLIAHHEGELPHGRIRSPAPPPGGTLETRAPPPPGGRGPPPAGGGYSLESRSRPITYEDFFHFDYIIGMDEANRERLLELAPTEELARKVSLLPEWSERSPRDHVPDPYYGGAEGFEHVLDLLEICLPDLYEKTRPTA